MPRAAPAARGGAPTGRAPRRRGGGSSGGGREHDHLERCPAGGSGRPVGAGAGTVPG
ncbi:hypothetical protein FM106_24770 [Brachybacterium faecium]|nr:hypothetical protein FM106_24770 [Brachybacterium faecium]